MTNEPTFKELLKGKRNDYGISQNRLAVIAGISHHQLSNIETGKVIPNKNIQDLLLTSLERLNPDSPLTMLFDYVRIRFPTLDVRFVIEDILQIKMKHLIHEDYGFYSYTEHYAIGDIFILTSPDEQKGVLVELKGRGCRQFEAYLLGQNRSWYEFFNDCLIAKGIMKRLDLAINDKNGILDIPKLTAKCNNGECISVFRSFKSYRSGELHKREEKDFMGYTLYIGSLQSEVYFCLYEKDYEQYIKNGIPIEESPIKNRFEIRLKNERASLAVEDLLKSQDVEHTAFSIINRYIRFVDEERGKSQEHWKINPEWEFFIGKHRDCLKLTTIPEPYNFNRTLNWLSRQVAPTLKVAMKLDEINQTSIMEEIVHNARLSEKHQKLLKQISLPPESLIIDKTTVQQTEQ